MKEKIQRLNAVTQNLILGTVTGVIVGYNLKIFFQHAGKPDLIWLLFLLLGPFIGYFSGRERQRVEKLKKEKMTLEESLSAVENALNKSKKKYRLLVERASDAIFLTSAEGRFILFNEATSLLSGYSKEELKKINLSDLQLEETSEKNHKTWLDNGIYRYETKWKNKDGNIVYLEVNAKWIQFAEHRLILHIARDIKRRKEFAKEEKAVSIGHVQESKLIEMALANRSLYDKMLVPVTATAGTVQSLMKKYPEEAEKLSDLLSKWKNTRQGLQKLYSKSSRDMAPSPSLWNVNEIVDQELYCLETTMGLQGVTKQISYGENLPPVFGMGRKFSLTLGNVLKAAIESMKNSQRKELAVSTHSMDEYVLLEIRVNNAVSFRENLCRVIDPFFESKDWNNEEKMEISLRAYELVFNSLGAKMDVGTMEGGETIVKIRLSTAEQKKEKVTKTHILENSEKENSVII